MGSRHSVTLWGLWRSHRAQCRSVGSILEDAHAGRLPGIKPHSSGFGFDVTDQTAALAAMMKDAA